MDVEEKCEIFRSDKKGRGLRAKQIIYIGEALLSERPLASVLMNSKCRGVRCDYCFKLLERSLKCSRCKFAYYCDKICQAGEWTVHKLECRCLVKVFPRQPPDMCRLVAQLLFKFFWGKDQPKEERFILESLSGNNDLISNSRKEAFFTFAAVLQEYLKDCPMDLVSSDVYSLMCKISCNSFCITNAELNSLGTGIYKTAALLNHSCDPNCCAVFEGTTITIRAMREIQEGEELTVAYTDLLAPSSIRQAELLEGYMFHCRCTLCCSSSTRDLLMKSLLCNKCLGTVLLSGSTNGDWKNIGVCTCQEPTAVDAARRMRATACMDELDALYNEIKVVPSAEQHKQLEILIDRASNCLSPVNLSVLHACEVAMDGCLEHEDWKGALLYSLALEKGYVFYLTDYHPTLGIHYFKQGKLQILVDDMRSGISSLQKALRILSATHGSQHELVQQLQLSLSDACNEMADRERWLTIERMYND